MYTCSPMVIQSEYHTLSMKEIRLLNRGPSYVAPCQMQMLYNDVLSSDDDIIERQYEPLRKQLRWLFANFHIDLSCQMNFESQLRESFHHCFHQSIPSTLTDRIMRETCIIETIHCEVEQRNLLLCRTADNRNTFYLGSLKEFEQKCTDFMGFSSSYQYIDSITPEMSEQECLDDILDTIDTQLRLLYEKKVLDHDKMIQFQTKNQSNLKLLRLYFLPENKSDNQMVVHPRFTSYRRSPIWYLAQYVDRKIRPLFENVCKSTTVQNGDEFMIKWNQYRTNDLYGVADTLIATFKMIDLYSKISHRELLDALKQLLSNPLVLQRDQPINPILLLDLTSIVLQHNYFVYQHKIYRFSMGSPMNLSLTKLLCNIYLHMWQTPLCREIRVRNLFYVRFNDQGLLTWKDSRRELEKIFLSLENTLPMHVSMMVFINVYGHFMDCHIERDKRRFNIRPYRDCNVQPFTLPYFPGHPRLRYRQWYHYKIARALQYCQNCHDFARERLYIEATFLANGYSLDFIEHLWQQFLIRYGLSSSQFSCVHFLNFPQLASAVQRFLNDELIRNSLQGEEYKLYQQGKIIHMHYLYDWGLRCEFNRKFEELCRNLLQEDSIFKQYDLKIKLTSKHRYLSNVILTHPRTHIQPIE